VNAVTELLTVKMVNALGWTLFHSLWQGVLAALALAGLAVLMRNFSARTRYVVAITILALVVGLSLVSFINSYHAETSGRILIQPDAVDGPPSIRDVNEPSVFVPPKTIFRKASGSLSAYFNRHFPLIVTLWLLGMFFSLLRFISGFALNQRLRYFATRPLPETVADRCREFLSRLKIRNKIKILESGLAKSPMVIGHLKPVLLFPLGLVAGLPPGQVEAILAHELAHILRRDYLINLLQSIVDVLYFYHPGVRWISSFIRSEREHCCDDLALSFKVDSLDFAKALAAVQAEGYGKPSAPAVAFANREGRLLVRVKRLFSKRRRSTDFSEGLVAAGVLSLSVLWIGLNANAFTPWTTGDPSMNVPGQADRKAFLFSPRDFDFNRFVLEDKSRIRIIGQADPGNGSSPRILSWIIDESTGAVVWSLDPGQIRQTIGGAAYDQEIELNRGRYVWHFSREEVSLLKILSRGGAPVPKSPAGSGASRSADVRAGEEPIRKTEEANAVPEGTDSDRILSSREVDFSYPWKDHSRRIRASIVNGHVVRFRLDNIRFLPADIEKNWDFIVKAIGEHEQYQFAYKRPEKKLIEKLAGMLRNNRNDRGEASLR